MTTEKNKLDPILVAVLDKRFSSIAEEMARSMIRASRSPTFFEVRDCCTAIFTADLRLVAMQDFVPALAYAMPVTIKHIAKAYEGDINEGDIFIQNDPYAGNNHLPDVNIAKPVFHNGKLVFWGAAKGHFDDIGGRGICSYDPRSTSIHDDGLVIPPCKLYDGGKFNRSVQDLIVRNIGRAEVVLGDIACEVGSVTLGERRMLELLDRHGAETLLAAMDETMAATERDIRSRVELIPDGVYTSEQMLDPDPVGTRDKPITLRLTVTKKGSDVTLDYTGSDPQVKGFVNSSWANLWAESIVSVFFTLPPGNADVKRNEGASKPFHIIAPEGLVVNSKSPAPQTTCTTAISDCVVSLVTKALSQAIPEYTPAGCGHISASNYRGSNPRTGMPFETLDFQDNAIGQGAIEGYDGWPTLGMQGGQGWSQLPDIEIMQMVTPMRVLRNEHLLDELTPGKFCGGPGKIYKIQYLTDLSCVLWGSGFQEYSAPHGLFGGHNAKPLKNTLHRADGTVENIEANSYYDVKAGDIMEKYIQGGGGYGDPIERDTWRVQEDVSNERVSIEKAKEIYGVVIDPDTLEVDVEATSELRKKHKSS